MRKYPVKTPALLMKSFPNFIWKRDGSEKKIFITIDDGPTAELNSRILEILESRSAKATFFCVGDNLLKYPEEAQKIIDRRHTVANHTHNHLNGWTKGVKEYTQNVEQCESHLTALGVDSKYFRPPYGRIKVRQSKTLMQLGYKIVMWDVLSGDFDKATSKEKCLEQSIKNTEPGSIIVFHDNLKCEDKIEYVLSSYIDHFKAEGFSFEAL